MCFMFETSRVDFVITIFIIVVTAFLVWFLEGLD